MSHFESSSGVLGSGSKGVELRVGDNSGVIEGVSYIIPQGLDLFRTKLATY